MPAGAAVVHQLPGYEDVQEHEDEVAQFHGYPILI